MMYSQDHYRDYKPRKLVTRMDPDCAICRAPASRACECEAQGLEIAITQAETQMMQSMYDEIKHWVREHARDFILEYFGMLKERRIKAHDQAIERIKTQAYYYHHAQPHPNDIAAAQAAFKRGIDEDWQSSVQRYPEVLDYYYGLVELQLPSDDDPKVRDPPLSALSGSRKARRPAPATITNGPDSMGAAPPPQPQQQPPPPSANRISYPHQREVRGRTPPPPPVSERMGPMSERMGPMSERMMSMPMPMPMERRTPVPQNRRSSFRNPPPPPPSSYYPPY
ncbi:hypothetical protein F503_04446 [Ophiostoma piceae UAMH 11346]|uniref:Serine threonine protein phosphatase n=1 Tax=Ophiostoma piceae (strain UAMH 11346) TaxID=1262450 RepID=S3C5Q6_OPHP1|nr:hypothetical protein F503_04446 [Ophiostoma piceae UAMH 11346]